MTGGLGFIGSNLVDALKNSHNVVVVDNNSSSREDWQELVKNNQNVEYVFSCYSEENMLCRIQGGEFDGIFHLAAIPRVLYSVENPVETTDTNILASVKLIDSAVKGKVKRFVFSSSSSVYGGADDLPTPTSYPKNPKSPYAWHKSAIEEFLRIQGELHGLDSVCLRYFNVFGPGQFGGSAYATAVSAWCNAIKEGKELRKDGTGDQTRDMCYVDNVVQANILAMKSEKDFKGERFNVACGDRTSNNEILDFLTSRYENLIVKKSPFRKGDVMHTQADISNTKKILGYDPTVRFWEGLELTLEWWNLS